MNILIKKLKPFFEFVLFFLLLSISILLAVDKRYSIAVVDGIKLWFACVMPALFPYFFITTILSSLKVTGKISNLLTPVTTRLFGVSGCVGYAFVMSLISGYPVGARTVADLREKALISESESVRASALCSTSSPTFLIGSVGNLMFKNASFGLLLFLSHIITAVLTGIIFSFYKRKSRPFKTRYSAPDSTIDNVLYESAYSSVMSVLVVGGLITIFYLLTEILLSLKVLQPIIFLVSSIVKDEQVSKSIVLGLIECTKGLSTLSTAKFCVFTLPLASLICSFGGLSVITQSLAYLKKAKIKTAPFILSKIISAVLSFFVALLFSLLFF